MLVVLSTDEKRECGDVGSIDTLHSSKSVKTANFQSINLRREDLETLTGVNCMKTTDSYFKKS